MRKLLFVAILIATFLIALTVTVVALTQIWSNEVTVVVSDYVFTVSDPADGTIHDTYTFSGSLTLGGSPVEGQTVELYVDDIATALTDVTDVSGLFSIDWSTSVAGTYDFKVSTDV